MIHNGLDDIVVAATVLSDVDGAAGRLVIRGHDLGELAGRQSFEQVLHLLWQGFFAALPDPAELTARLGAARAGVYARVEPLLPALAQRPVYDGMRAGLALLEDGTTLDDALRLVAAPAVLTPALLRLQAGGAPLPPDPALGHAADVVRMLEAGSFPLDSVITQTVDFAAAAEAFRQWSETPASVTKIQLAIGDD